MKKGFNIKDTETSAFGAFFICFIFPRFLQKADANPQSSIPRFGEPLGKNFCTATLILAVKAQTFKSVFSHFAQMNVLQVACRSSKNRASQEGVLGGNGVPRSEESSFGGSRHLFRSSFQLRFAPQTRSASPPAGGRKAEKTFTINFCV